MRTRIPPREWRSTACKPCRATLIPLLVGARSARVGMTHARRKLPCRKTAQKCAATASHFRIRQQKKCEFSRKKLVSGAGHVNPLKDWYCRKGGLRERRSEVARLSRRRGEAPRCAERLPAGGKNTTSRQPNTTPRARALTDRKYFDQFFASLVI